MRIPEIQCSNFARQRLSQICLKLTTGFSPSKHCHFVNSLSHKGQFKALFSGLYHPQLHRVLSLTYRNGTAGFHLRVWQVTDGASMGPRDVITMVYRGFPHPNLQAGTAFNHEVFTGSCTSATWVPWDTFCPSPPSQSRSPGSSLSSHSGCRAWLTPWWIFSNGFSRYCSHQECLHSLQQISLVNSRKVLRQVRYLSGYPTNKGLTDAGKSWDAGPCKAMGCAGYLKLVEHNRIIEYIVIIYSF